MEQWVVAELNSRGEKEDPDLLKQSIRQLVDAEVFIPASISKVGEDKVIRYLVEGYVFIRRTQPDTQYFRLEGSKYVQAVLTKPGVRGPRPVRELACVPSTEIDRMRKQIRIETEQGIEVGDQVLVTSGAYKGISGTVISEIPEKESVQVYIQLRSKQVIVTLPRSFLKFERKGGAVPQVSYTEIAFKTREWYNRIRNVLLYPMHAVRRMVDAEGAWSRLTAWGEKLSNMERHIELLQTDLDSTSILQKWTQVKRFEFWMERGRDLYDFVNAFYLPLEPAAMVAKWREWERYNDFSERLSKLTESVEQIENSLTTGPEMIQNVIVDGHNLAMRCLFAPGMADLSSKNRPTGMILGFLRSLAAYRKRFPNADFWVCWDGSSQFRRGKFAGYKANRHRAETPGEGAESFNQFVALAGLLPALGVNQVTNPEEESDDLIATLVRGPLKGQRNVIISNDQDFMQLVTATDVVLVPKTGPRPERIFDETSVLDEYGIEPAKMVHLRALQGDTSDNIPGVPRVPSKVLLALLKSHETVDGIYESSLAGLTKLQYEKLREAEKQVRLNVELMSLRSVDYKVHDATPNEELVKSTLADLDIQAEPFLTAFLAPPAKGFAKTG